MDFPSWSGIIKFSLIPPGIKERAREPGLKNESESNTKENQTAGELE